MRRIPLTRNKYALIDDEDCPLVNQYKWQAGWYGQWTAVTGPNKKTSGRQLQMHRLIMGVQPGQEVDHKEHYEDHIDNRKSNLRICSHTENMYNRRKHISYAGKKTSSQYKGVSWNKQRQKWCGRIQVGGEYIHLGLFINEDEAARAYDTAAREHFGEFASLNEPSRYICKSR